MSLTPSPLIAFGFSSPLLLSGLALASIPVVIHLLHRRRYVETPWAAMRFLIEATKKQSRRMRLQNLILLLIRTLALILIVLSLARPHFETEGGVGGESQPTHRVLVVDSTFSMQRAGASGSADAVNLIDGGEVETTRFAQAKRAALAMVESGSRGDAWNLIRIAEVGPTSVVQTPAFRAETVTEEIKSLAVADSPANLTSTFEAVGKTVEQLPELPRKEVVFFTDFQEGMWSPQAAESVQRLNSLAQKIGKSAQISFVNVSGSSNSNCAVTALESDAEIVTVDQIVNFRAVFRNFAKTTVRDQTVEILVDGRLVDTRRVDLPVGSDVPFDWQHRFLSPGDHSVEVHLQDDSLALDNRRWIIVPVREQLNVLLVNGRPSGKARDSATYYIERALAPSTSTEPWQGTISPQVLGESELRSVSLSRYDVIVLCDVGLITDREASLLESFVLSGGGLIVLPGKSTNATSYNTHLFRDGEGILPAKLGELTGSEEKPLAFDPREFAHSTLRAFRGNPGAGLEATMTFQYLALNTAEDARVALWFSDGSPAIVEKQAGSGRAVLAATSADSRWGTWAIWAPSFVPMMHELVLFAASGQSRNRQLRVGEPIVTALPQRLFDLDVQVKQPDGTMVGVPLNDSDTTLTAAFDATARAGVYEVQFGSPVNRTELYAVNVNEAESDLTSASHSELAAEVFKEANVAARGVGGAVLGSEPEGNSTLSILSRILAWTVLCILLLEPLLAWRFSWGMIGLGAAVLCALLAPALGWGATAVVALSGAAGAVWWSRTHATRQTRSVADQ